MCYCSEVLSTDSVDLFAVRAFWKRCERGLVPMRNTQREQSVEMHFVTSGEVPTHSRQCSRIAARGLVSNPLATISNCSAVNVRGSTPS